MSQDTPLDSLAPETAIQMYLQERSGEVADRTLQAHEYRLKHFRRWCEDQGLEDLNALTGRHLHQFRLWRQADGNLKPVSLRTQLETFRVFLRFCASVDAVPTGLPDKLHLPTLGPEDDRAESLLEADRAEAALEYLRQFDFASRDHVILSILWHTGIRLGTLHGLDVRDYDSERASLALCHRPETGTPLKNGPQGERPVALSPAVCAVLDGWLAHKRPAETDDHGREPLVSTRHGRMSQSAIREVVYGVTRPCAYGQDCPHGRDREACEATSYGSRSTCPSSRSPHAVRRGSITHYLTEDVPEEVVSDRMNVGREVLEAHYDKRSPEQKMEQRRDYLEDL